MCDIENYLRTNNIYVTLYDLPYSSHGFVLKHKDQYIIILNARIDFIQQQKVFLHELAHILLKHFEDNNENEEQEANEFMNLAYPILCYNNQSKEDL